MTMQLHTLVRTSLRAKRRKGRGQASGQGKTSGRGGKGQTARAGAKIRPAWRDIIKKLPKRRGYGKNRGRTVVVRARPVIVSLDMLERSFESGAEITSVSLREKKLLNGREASQRVKVIGTGTLSKKLMVKGCGVSASAKAAIEKAGGSVQ